MEFLVEFRVRIPGGTPPSEIEAREKAEAASAANLADLGHLRRLWKVPVSAGPTNAVGIYQAGSEVDLDILLRALPLYEWMQVDVTPLEPHPNDPVGRQPAGSDQDPTVGGDLPKPSLSLVYRLEVVLGQALELGTIGQDKRRIVPLEGGSFTGPVLNGKLLPAGSADWQTMLPDGTTLGDIQYTLQTDRGDLLHVRARGVRHGSADVLARLSRGEQVDPSEYTFRTSTQIETATRDLEWLNKGIFVSVAARQAGGVTYETYLVG